ncbi:MAG: FKBP-type peptidyl-prolyl cis-trans isomerase [Opitutales bacterium]
MKLNFSSLVCLAALLLPGVALLRADPAPGLVGHWRLDVAKSTPVRPWDAETLAFTVTGDTVQITRRLQWGEERKVNDVTSVKADGRTVTANPVSYWLDTWYTNVYLGGDHQKHVSGEWLDQGRILKVESTLALEGQQGDHPVHIYDEYRLAPDGQTLMQFELRSTRDQALVYVFDRVTKFEEPPGMVTTASGLKYFVTHHGGGPQPQPGQVVIAHYTGTLADGTIFDSSHLHGDAPFAFTLGKKQVIKGWDEGFALLHVGDQATFIIPANLAYGDKPAGSIPPGSALQFEVEFLGVKAHALSDLVREILEQSGIAAAQKRVAELQASGFGDYYVNESQLNALGYHYLQHDQLPVALAVFQIYVGLFPKSGNAHDSLGEAWLKNGQKDQALQEYRESLRLDPTNDNAVKVIAELTKTK